MVLHFPSKSHVLQDVLLYVKMHVFVICTFRVYLILDKYFKYMLLYRH